MSVAEIVGSEQEGLRASLERLRAAWRSEPDPEPGIRRARLRALRAAMVRRKDDVAEAVRSDFGARSKHETWIAEIVTTAGAVRHMERHLERWMRPERRRVSSTLWLARAELRRQPLGVVGVIAPWNYPFHLAVLPVATAVAAGNRVMLKPSELTPATGELLRELLVEALGDDVVAVHTGGVEVGRAFASLPLDHLLYTGSTAVGREIMKAAAENLTPVTLELGGKSPAILHRGGDVARFADRVVYGKLLNAGQTCIAPDYALVPRGLEQAVVDAVSAEVARRYPTLATNPDYTSIVNERHHARLLGLLDDAVSKGARVVELDPAGEAFDEAHHKLAPRLLLDVTDDMRVLQEEIFGPFLPVVPYDTLDDAIAYVNARPRPLALYYFDVDAGRVERVLRHTVAGGTVINDTMIHAAVEDLPFGGVGASGMGAYHGREGFETFTHARAVVRQRRLNGMRLLDAPYGARVERLLDWLLR